MARKAKPGKTIRRNELERYKYVYGCFTARMYGYHVNEKTPKTNDYDFSVIVIDLKDDYGVIGDGHLWIKSLDLFKYYAKNRLVQFYAKASIYKKYNGLKSYDLVNVKDIKILNNCGGI